MKEFEDKKLPKTMMTLDMRQEKFCETADCISDGVSCSVCLFDYRSKETFERWVQDEKEVQSYLSGRDDEHA